MLTVTNDDPCTYRSNEDIEEILHSCDAYIVALARAKLPRTGLPLVLLSDEREELAQGVRIKLWQTLQTRRVLNLKAYIGCMVFTEVIDLLRRRRAHLLLPLEDEAVSCWQDVRAAALQDTDDPASQIEQEEVLDELSKQVATALLHLPPRQFQAMIWALKDRLDDFLPLLDALEKSGVKIDEIHWPQANNEVKNWQASLSIARKKLRPLKRQWIQVCQ
jgi:DNA-directed RNA polymerase specialized sigma24 family protein